MNEYRIVRDGYCGFEVQVRRRWFPFWMEVPTLSGKVNTHTSIEKAEHFAQWHATGGVVKHLGRL